MKTARDCRYFKGNQPCVYHKREGAACRCARYRHKGIKILIIQLGGIGDVIRTTPIIARLKKHYPVSTITWVTGYPAVIPPSVDTVLEFNDRSVIRVAADAFDLVLNFDKSEAACALCTAVKAGKKKGFLLKDGVVSPADRDAVAKYELGLNDAKSRKCFSSFPAQAFAVAGYTFAGEKYDFPLGVAEGKKLVGLNTGCGERWPARMWGERKWIQLAAALKKMGYEPLLLGGEAEHYRNLRISRLSAAQYTGCHSLRLFSLLVSACDVIVTVPTMAMHVGIALGKKVVLLNNVFNKNEFELYGRGEIIEPEVGCLGCYKEQCGKKCLDSIAVSRVAAAVRRLEAL